MARRRVFGMCNPILDVILKTDMKRLNDLGLNVGTTIVGKDEEVFKLISRIVANNEEINFVIGGSLLNSLRVCKDLSNKDKNSGPIPVFFSGGISDDSGGILLQELLTGAEIDYKFHISDKPNLETGRCLVLVTNNERTLITGLGSAKDYSVKTFDSNEIQQALAESKIVATSGYFIEVCFEAVLKAAKYCDSSRGVGPSCSFVLGLSAEFVPRKYIKELYQLFPMIDFMVGNEKEFLSLYKYLSTFIGKSHYGKTGLETIDELAKLVEQEEGLLDEFLKDIYSHLKLNCTILCTRGPKPVISLSYCDDGVKIKHHKCIYVPRERLVDFNGCGDAFLGGFIYGLSNSFPLDASVYMGHFAASNVSQNVGCSFDFSNKPTLEEILCILREQE
ncbi:hypothetical protein FG379_001684 [Cryptosporidium bovis]|uniref:uncharacterized protein n=1 Tax=Cryptosporidium bovis TaxID=310047 RepID=UPI003519FBFE|nr:hypothetical protein FG379_001684 [Cryptosporidium bovis]